MNKSHKNITLAVFCPKCGEENPTKFIDQPNTSAICHNHTPDYIYFPFGRLIDETEPQALCTDKCPETTKAKILITQPYLFACADDLEW